MILSNNQDPQNQTYKICSIKRDFFITLLSTKLSTFLHTHKNKHLFSLSETHIKIAKALLHSGEQ